MTNELPDPAEVARAVTYTADRNVSIQAASAMREAMLRWIVERWGPCCKGLGAQCSDSYWGSAFLDEARWCPACVARRELER